MLFYIKDYIERTEEGAVLGSDDSKSDFEKNTGFNPADLSQYFTDE
jgi:hypothetical protein